MREEDWSGVTDAGKAVFLFDGDEQPSTGGRQKEPQPLSVEEIVEVVATIPRGCSGSDFFNMVLDSHPSLLTIAWHGLASFPVVYKIFFEGKTASEAIERLKHPVGEAENFLWYSNIRNALTYRYNERLPRFFEALESVLDSQKVYGAADCFRAFYIAINAAVGRTFRQRIAPAIFYDQHRGDWQRKSVTYFGFSLQRQEAMKEEMLQGFRYRKTVGIVRAPISTLGTTQNFMLTYGPNQYQPNPLVFLKYYASGEPYGCYIDADDPKLESTRQVRFEDLKLFPRETTEALCAFLRIPWSETCLHITTNGEDSGIMDGTEGFDITPVYKTHPEHLSALDSYRIELLNAKNFEVWGYKLRYYDGQKYSPDELKKLFDLPFKVEQQTLDAWPDWPDAEVSKEFHAWIYQRALEVTAHGENCPPKDAAGRPKKLVPCLRPELSPGQRLYTDGAMPTSGQSCVSQEGEREADGTKRYIYGAGDFGRRLGHCFQVMGKAFYGFIVSEGAPASMRLGLPVVNVGDFHERDATVYIAIADAEAVRAVKERLLQKGLAPERIVDASGFIHACLRPWR